MAAPYTDLQTLIASARASLVAGDNAAALLAATEMELVLAGMPDSEGAGVGLRFDRKAIASAIETIRRQANAATGIQRQKIDYVRPS